MSIHTEIRGAAPVGHVAELGPLEAAAVCYLRLWCDSPGAQEQVRRDFAGTLGPVAGHQAAGALEDLCGLCARHGRRALMRHQPSCTCLGADEACFANLIALATEGEREDALLIATLIVRADVAAHLMVAAQTFGLAIKRMALRLDHRGTVRPPRNLH
jgi:hypothetical protein